MSDFYWRFVNCDNWLFWHVRLVLQYKLSRDCVICYL